MTLTGYNLINLTDMVDELGQDFVKEKLSEFSCPQNRDVEYFLRSKALEFSIQGLSKTHLVYTSYKDMPVLIGYFTLCSKVLSVPKKSLSRGYRDRIHKFSQDDRNHDSFLLTASLIAQLGKNFHKDYNQLITGDELLCLALDKLSSIRHEIGGSKIVYLECEDTPKLVKFYSDNGFVKFGNRSLDKDEEDRFKGRELVQMMRYM